MTAVTFPPAINGSGRTYTDDNDPNTGMADGGHQERWMPLMQDVVAAAEYVSIYAQDIDTADANAQAAALSEQHAATSATNAAASAAAAANSATNAAASVTTATASATAAAAASATAANASQQAATTSATAAATSATAAATSATAANTSEQHAAQSATTAQTAAATALAAPGTASTSTTALTLQTGSKILTTQTGKAFVVGMSVKIANTADGTQWMHGDITAYNSNTGALTVIVTIINGSGTFSTWTISLSAPVKPITGLLADGTEITLW